MRVKIWCDRAATLSKCCSTVDTTRKPSRGLVTFRAIGLRPCQCAVNTTRKPSRGLATLRVKIWGDRAATLSKCCKYHTKTEQGFSHFACQIFGAIGLRPCQSAVNTTRKPSRGLATFRVKIWCDRAATLSKCCKYHTKTEQGFSKFPCQNLGRSGCDPVNVL